MQTVSGAFTAASMAAGQNICTYVEVSWDGSGALADARGAAHWTDETPYLVSYSAELRIEPPGEALVPAGDIGSGEVVLFNAAGRYNWQDTDGASPLTAYITGATAFSGKLLRIWQGYDGEYVCIFTGAISGFTPTTVDGVLRLQCRDVGWLYLQDKQSSSVAYDQLPNVWIAWLATQGGITTATLDIGIYRIPYCSLDDESLVEEIWQAAEADGGVCYFDSRGYLHYENVLHWASGSSVWTFDEGTYQRAETRADTDAVATKVTVEWAGRVEAPEEVVYTLDRPKSVPAGGNLQWQARFNYAVTDIFAPSVELPLQDYAAVSLGGVDITSSLAVVVSDINAQQTTVSVTNTHPTRTAQITFLQIRGMPLLGGPTEQESADVTPAPYTFERVRAIRGNPYLQTQVQGAALASLLAVRCARIHPRWTLSGMPGVPQLELSDRVTFVDLLAQGAANARTCVVLGIRSEWSLSSGFQQTVNLWDVTSLLAYDNYFIIGVSALGLNDVRCYY